MKLDEILSDMLITEAVEKCEKRKEPRIEKIPFQVWLFSPSFSFQRSDCLLTTRTRSTFIGQPDSSSLPKFWACSNFHGSIELRFPKALRSASLFHPLGNITTTQIWYAFNSEPSSTCIYGPAANDLLQFEEYDILHILKCCFPKRKPCLVDRYIPVKYYITSIFSWFIIILLVIA